ncbi:hypothetical protein TanjilG_19334 [Lupinus angustifolius]|uniref:Bet v I/Major latex protein domain-containing protein n=1 Tax=Lupinus angustifolius TaxID=3871 RepID=A0A1J7GRH4_LUPAN|nr:PREDICTED: MLP-like protein 31 [Lupinus angustifolius]OIW03054.1 hypothetical protein TanjilG_19334 [Lupinus angustifolius]
MALSGILSSEIGIKAPASKWFNLFTKQLQRIPIIVDGVEKVTLLQGDWHTIGSVKQWSELVDGKVATFKEKIEAIDEKNKWIRYNIFDGEMNQHYKVYILTIQVIEKDDGSASIKWTIEYEKVNESLEPPYHYMDSITKGCKDIDAELLKN